MVKKFFFFFFLYLYILSGCSFITTAAGSLAGSLGADIINEELENKTEKAQQCGD
jgi:ABC-type transport system involved in multi-copper enzyme maturation permease subunit